MEFLMHPSIWVGLVTLVILEIVLGIDNVVFIAILAEKMPLKKRDRARVIGLSLALVMRLGLLSLISWIVTLTKPLVSIDVFSLSWRDIILLLGGTFLLFKATTELHERLENQGHDKNPNRVHTSFWIVVIQIVILDAVFSLDAVITAIGMVNNLPVMMTAVVIATSIMLLASKALTKFVTRHPTFVVLCLSFLLMIGLSLISEGLGFHIPKGYLYAAIGFSTLIELFNQIARHNFIKNQSIKPMRERTAEAIMRLMGGQEKQHLNQDITLSSTRSAHFAEEERHMITGVLSLASRRLRSVMTPRNEITWLDCKKSVLELRETLTETPHNMFPVCDGELDHLIGIVRAKDLIAAVDDGISVKTYAAANPPIVVPQTLDALNLLKELRRARGGMIMVLNEFGVVQGLVTPLDLLEAIAGEFPDEDETPEIEVYQTGWLVKGSTDLHALQQALNSQELVRGRDHLASLAGLLLSRCDRMPVEADILEIEGWRFTIREMSEYRIERVWVERIEEFPSYEKNK